MTPAVIAGFLAALARTAAFLQAAPITGDITVPPRLRLTAAIVIAAAIAPVRPPVDPSDLAWLLPGELLLGAAAGFMARLVIAGAESGGQIIGLSIGLGFASSVDPSSGETALTARRMAWCIAGLAFLMAGGLESAVVLLAVAPANATSFLGLLQAMIDHGGEMFIAALRFAGPAIVVGLGINAMMALASRAAPALNVFSVMLAGLMVVGGAVMLETAPSFTREMAALGRRAASSGAGALGL